MGRLSQQKLYSTSTTHTSEKPLKPYQCSQCDIYLTEKTSITVYLRTHTGEKPYKYRQRVWALIVKWNIKSYLRTHTDENRFTFSQHESAFKAKLNVECHLRTHMSTRPNDKPYQYNNCEKAFM